MGLTHKQRLVIEDLAKKINQGKPMDAASSTQKFYDVKNRKNAQKITYRNFKSSDFRNALLQELDRYQVIGKDSKVSTKLTEGLEATNDRGNIDFNARLKYIQEINKIAGIYAPTQSETKTMNLNVDITKEELDDRIKQLQSELGE